ncbi:TonB-dependent receptor [uncultured Bacteroides sp.]|uniref:SusC/RagA family TonB-linked outer membrane protein n=1 Tax=uncultured Bacteroides sp. TaxID=162156 RepID=UPI002AA6E2E3|nr:TonB-dependent receptor [uncultured Bacteroides sp.]
MRNHLLFLTFFLFVCAAVSAQQTKKISGSVYDQSTGEALIGVSAVEKGTGNGTITDLDGKYSLSITSNQVSFSYVGYKTQTITVNQSGTINVKLISDNKLEEVVVIGYGTQKKSDLTGSLASISSKDIKNYAVSNASELLTGKAAGVFVAASSGQPGSDAVIRVRGLGTVNDNNPLYVVDGQFMDNISTLNPSDIEHIEVLKDASACAIYGSKGSNGVILITTKGGVKGQTIITLDAYTGIKNSYKALNMMNSEQYYNFITEAYKDDSSFQNSMKEKFTNQYNKGYDTDWWKAVTHTAFTQNYNVSVRTGTDKSRSSLSLGYIDDQGAIITTDFQRLTLKLSQEYDLSKYITVGTNINLAKIKKRDAGAIPSFDFIQKADPFTPVISPLVDPSSENYKYNKYAPTEWSYDPNPVSMLELPNRYDDIFNVFGNVYAQVKLYKNLTYRVQYSFERYHDTFKDFRPIFSSTFSDDNLANQESKYSIETQLNNNSNVTFNSLVEQRLNYNTTIGKHKLDAMVAITYEKNKDESINAFKRNALGNEDIYQILDAQTAGDKVSGSKETSSMLSYLGRINYSYDDRYLATVNFRADGSSKFAKNNRWGYFPSLSVGWRISNEEFFKNLNIDNAMSNLKLRVGWGQNGNQRIDTSAPLTLIGTNDEMQWYFGNGYSQGYTPTYVGNADIKWETSQQTNVGVDMSFLRNSLDVSMDFYVKKTSDMLLNMPIPSFGAFPNSPYFNAGNLKNTGFELVANYRNHIGRDFNYNIGANLSTYKTKVTKLTSEYLSGNVSRTYVGGPIGRFWGYKQIGIFQNQAEIDSYVDKDGTKIQPNAKPGDFKFAKLGESGQLNDDDDRTFIGNPNPDIIYGFNLGFAYKSFDLSMAFQGTLGNDIWNVAKGTLSSAGRQNALEEAYTKAWTKEGDNAKYPRITNSDSNNNMRNSSFYVEDGSYLRLQNIQLGYTIPEALCLKTKLFSSCRFYISGQNLLTLTGYSGLDPELGINSPLDMGVDTTHYPSSRTFTVGVNMQF